MEMYYCATCDVDVDRKELVDNKCPYCDTEKPEEVEESEEEQPHE